MDADWEKQADQFLRNYGKFYCKRHMLEQPNDYFYVPVKDMDALLDKDLDKLEEQITSFLSFSTVDVQDNDAKINEVRVDNKQDPDVHDGSPISNLDISDEKVEEQKVVPPKQLPYYLSDRFKNLKRFLRIIKGNQGTHYMRLKAKCVRLNASVFHLTFNSSENVNIYECAPCC